VLVVDDNAGFRESLLSLLFAGNLQVVGEAGSGAEALTSSVRSNQMSS
jgi:DNA-binding NarL/FixJ family response regulator